MNMSIETRLALTVIKERIATIKSEGERDAAQWAHINSTYEKKEARCQGLEAAKQIIVNFELEMGIKG